MEVSLEVPDIILTSPVDPFYGMRTKRRIHLDQTRPAMTITTTYERVSGDPSQVGVWVITQLKHPVRMFMPIPSQESSPKKYVILGRSAPPDLKVDRGMVSLSRNAKESFKIGTEAGAMVWVGEKQALRIESPRLPNLMYPDQGSSTEIYTSPDPLPYVEFETLGPLHSIKAGQYITRTNTYTLFRRTEKNPDVEARKIFAQ